MESTTSDLPWLFAGGLGLEGGTDFDVAEEDFDALVDLFALVFVLSAAWPVRANLRTTPLGGATEHHIPAALNPGMLMDLGMAAAHYLCVFHMTGPKIC